jgi:hypothetical protein
MEKKLSWLQRCILGDIYALESQGENGGISATDIIRKNYGNGAIHPKHRVIVCNSLKRLIFRDLLQRVKNIHSEKSKTINNYIFTEKGRTAAEEVLASIKLIQPEVVEKKLSVNEIVNIANARLNEQRREIGRYHKSQR